VTLRGSAQHLHLRIANDVVPGGEPQPFTPRSITERATALGGAAQVAGPTPGETVIVVDIPL
jgi:hypothetical protein